MNNGMNVPEAGTFTTSTADGQEVAFTCDDDGAITVLTTRIPMEGIRIDGGTQSRVSLHEPTVAEYAEVVRNGGQLPAIVVFEDGAEVWLADGFHRFHAHRAAGVGTILCEVHFGTRRDAILYSAGANASHGRRRTNEDKRRAVLLLLNDLEWAAWSDNQIAKACGVSHPFVGELRRSILKPLQDSPGDAPALRTVTRNGTTYKQHTANIGKPAAAPLVQASAAPPAAAIVNADVEALHKQVAELSAALKSSLAENEMMRRVIDADDKLKAAIDEAKRQQAIAGNAECRFSVQSAELLKRTQAVKRWMQRSKIAEASLAKMVKSK
jgi:hypothetical protein